MPTSSATASSPSATRSSRSSVNEAVRVACAQVEPVVFDRAGTLDKLAATAADAAGQGAQLVLFPETFVPAYPSSRWVRALAAGGGKEVWARLARSSVTVPSTDTDAMGAVAKQHGIVLAVGVNELDGATLYNALLVFAPDGELVLRHRKLMPTNHERMVWGLGDGSGLETIETALGRVGGLICWENFMPLARAALYESGIDIYLAPTADDTRNGSASTPPVTTRGPTSCTSRSRPSARSSELPQEALRSLLLPRVRKQIRQELSIGSGQGYAHRRRSLAPPHLLARGRRALDRGQDSALVEHHVHPLL